MRTLISTIFLAFMLFGPITASALTPDGETPAVETVCEEGTLGGALKGLCNAYCEAMDCDSANPTASIDACEAVRNKFRNKSDGIDPPCILPPEPDTDLDGIPDDEDNCKYSYNPLQLDSDSDGVGDVCDNCVDNPNPGQEDLDGDGVGDSCDNCPTNPNQNQIDTDGNGVGDACELPVINDAQCEVLFDGSVFIHIETLYADFTQVVIREHLTGYEINMEYFSTPIDDIFPPFAPPPPIGIYEMLITVFNGAGVVNLVMPCHGGNGDA